MATIDYCFNLLKYRGNSNSYLANISPDEFNFLWPQAELRFFNAKYKQYGVTKKTNDTLTKVKVLLNITMPTTGGTAGQYTFPTNLLHESSVMSLFNGILQEVTQFEDDRLGPKLSNSVDPPTTEFPIYVRYATYLQFYPLTLGSAVLTYLKEPTASYWAYTLNGTILTLNTVYLNAGSAYTNGVYLGVYLAGGSGSGARANFTVAGNVVTICTLTDGGKNYLTTDTLFVNNSLVGGTGSGFSIPVATILANTPRPVWNPSLSVNPVYSDTDIDDIVYLILQDFGIQTRDTEVENFALTQQKINA